MGRENIRIGSGQGFWGDRIDAPLHLTRLGHCDYIGMDYLAEVTMSIMQKQKLRDPSLGYARDFPVVVSQMADYLREGGVVISNAGGVNPRACAEKTRELLAAQGLGNIPIGVVAGDDILQRLDDLQSQGHPLANMDSGQPLSEVRDKVVTANVYFGAEPIVQALQAGAKVIITGRCTDTGLTLAPMIYEFGWAMNDWNRLAAGTVAGHIVECGTQCTGGNFLGDWRAVPDMANIGYPIVEAQADGGFVITKSDGTGGLVNRMTVAEQVCYELGNPADYISPDCRVDFTSITVEEEGENRVRVSGVQGAEATDTYKVSAAYHEGYKAAGTLTYSWPDAVEKARFAGKILEQRIAELGLRFEEVKTEVVGLNACHGTAAPTPQNIQEIPEVVLRVAVRGQHKEDISRWGAELAPLILTGPPAVTGFAGGRPKPSEVIAYWPALLKKSAVTPTVEVI